MKNLKKMAGKGIGRIAVIAARAEANAACPYLTYEPKKPEAVKKLRKF